jgi:hypothetical protein
MNPELRTASPQAHSRDGRTIDGVAADISRMILDATGNSPYRTFIDQIGR